MDVWIQFEISYFWGMHWEIVCFSALSVFLLPLTFPCDFLCESVSSKLRFLLILLGTFIWHFQNWLLTWHIFEIFCDSRNSFCVQPLTFDLASFVSLKSKTIYLFCLIDFDLVTRWMVMILYCIAKSLIKILADFILLTILNDAFLRIIDDVTFSVIDLIKMLIVKIPCFNL